MSGSLPEGRGGVFAAFRAANFILADLYRRAVYIAGQRSERAAFDIGRQRPAAAVVFDGNPVQVLRAIGVGCHETHYLVAREAAAVNSS